VGFDAAESATGPIGKLPRRRRCRGRALAHWTWVSRITSFNPSRSPRSKPCGGGQLFVWPDLQAPTMVPAHGGAHGAPAPDKGAVDTD
jgi:hypothetical protein